MSTVRYYAKMIENGRFELGTIVDGVSAPTFQNVSFEDARRTGRDLVEMGILLGPEFAIDCTELSTRKIA